MLDITGIKEITPIQIISVEEHRQEQQKTADIIKRNVYRFQKSLREG